MWLGGSFSANAPCKPVEASVERRHSKGELAQWGRHIEAGNGNNGGGGGDQRRGRRGGIAYAARAAACVAGTCETLFLRSRFAAPGVGSASILLEVWQLLLERIVICFFKKRTL